MTHGSIIGYDINAKMCQISYYNENTGTGDGGYRN